MAKKSELLKKKWSQLSKAEKAKFKSKSTFSERRQAQLTINQTTPKKPKKAAVTAIQQDKGKLKPKDVERIANETGLSTKAVTKLAINKVPDKTVSKKVDTSGSDKKTRADLTEGKGRKGAIKQLAADGRLGDKDIKFLTKNYPGIKASDIKNYLNKDKNADVKGPKSKIKTTIKDTRLTIKTGEGTGTKTDTSTDTGNGNGNGNGKDKEDKFDPDSDPLGEIEFPGSTSGKDFRKYKTQKKAIRKAAEQDLDNRMKESFKPEVLGKAAELKKKFKGDPTKKPKKLTGRAKREYRIKQVSERQQKLGIRRKPKFENYERRVKKIRKGEGAAKNYAYAGRFNKLGEKLGVKYGEKAREKRTKSRLTDLKKNIKAGPGKTYTTAADNAESQRRKGREAMEAFKIG